MKKSIKYGLMVVVIAVIAWVPLKKWYQDTREAGKYEMEMWERFSMAAHVISRDQDWEVAAKAILDIFEIDDDEQNWRFNSQWFEDDGFVDMPHYKTWRQCISSKADKAITYCREEEWAFSTIENRWILLNRRVYSY